MSYSTNDTPAPFKRGDFIAECHENADGTRSIAIYHAGMRISEPKKARIYDPFVAARLACWLVKAGEWVAVKVDVGKVGRRKKKKRKIHTSVSNPK